MNNHVIAGQASIAYWQGVDMDTRLAQLAKLREPFPESVIGTLPKGGVQLKYVGHAAITDRLLTVDPLWAWDYAMRDEHGNPITRDAEGNLLILLTVCGITREGTGDGATHKERIGDAIRNAAMRFGAALELWSRDELESVATARTAEAESVREANPISEEQVEAVLDMAAKAGLSNERFNKAVAWVSNNACSDVTELSADEGKKLYDTIAKMAEQATQQAQEGGVQN